MMWKSIGISALLVVSLHALLWWGLVAAESTIGLSDQSPVFVLVVLLQGLDSPVRWLFSGSGLASNQGLFFVLASMQWAVIGGGLGAMAFAFSRRRISSESGAIESRRR